jgi:hypothetical protein
MLGLDYHYKKEKEKKRKDFDKKYTFVSEHDMYMCLLEIIIFFISFLLTLCCDLLIFFFTCDPSSFLPLLLT